MNITIKKSIVAGVVAVGIAVPSFMYTMQKEQTKGIVQKVEQQQEQIQQQQDHIQQQQKEVDSLSKEIEQQKSNLNAVEKENTGLKAQIKDLNTKNEALKGKNQELEGIRNLVLDNVGYIPSREEIQLLENLVECEAGAEPYAGKVAVANVVFNRVKSKKFPNTIHDVIYQKNQFEPVVTGMIYNRTASADSKRAVREALQGKKVIGSDIMNFWADYLSPSNELWNHIPVEFKIGTTCFGKEWID